MPKNYAWFDCHHKSSENYSIRYVGTNAHLSDLGSIPHIVLDETCTQIVGGARVPVGWYVRILFPDLAGNVTQKQISQAFSFTVENQKWTFTPDVCGVYHDQKHNVFTGGVRRIVQQTKNGLQICGFYCDDETSDPAKLHKPWTASMLGGPTRFVVTFDKEHHDPREHVPVEFHLSANACRIEWELDDNIWIKMPIFQPTVYKDPCLYTANT